MILAGTFSCSAYIHWTTYSNGNGDDDVNDVSLWRLDCNARYIHFPQGSMIVQVQAVDGDAGVGNAVEYEIINGQ